VIEIYFDQQADQMALPKISHAQTGQDVLAEFILRRSNKIPRDKKYRGRYVDVGACYPIRASNTYYFYERGWKGLCVDANPATKKTFKKFRPRDRFRAEAVGETEGRMEFFTYTNPQWNSFDPERAVRKKDQLTGSYHIPIRPLSQMIEETKFQKIDLLSIDTEGFELQVLKSLDLDTYRPSLLLFECIRSIDALHEDEAVLFALENGYKTVAATGHDVFMLDTRDD